MEIKKKSVVEFKRTLSEQIILELFRKSMIDLLRYNDSKEKDCWFVSTTTGQCFEKQELLNAVTVLDAFLDSESFEIEEI